MSQDEFILLLFEDCGYFTTAARKAWMQARFSRDHSCEMTRLQKSVVIDALKAEKAGNRDDR